MANEIEEIKQRLDLVELVGQYVTLKKAGANYKAQCPFHQEKTASLMVSPEKQIWKCFGCNLGGDIYKFVMQTEHLEFGDALRLLAQKAGVTLQSRTWSEYQTRDNKETLYRINNAVAKVFQTILLERDAGKEALEYLKKRNIKIETIKQFAIGYTPKNFDLKNLLLKHGFTANDLAKAGSPERFFNRIMFPIFDVLNNPVGFTGRILSSGEPKYLNSPETPIFNKGRVLYGLNLAKAALKEKNYVVLVEGQMDVVALHQAGVTNAVASSGTAITETQLQLLGKYTPNFLLAFDNDSAGINTTKKVIESLLKLDLNAKVVDFGKFKDAGELFEKDQTAWIPMVKTAQEGVEWWIAGEIADTGQSHFATKSPNVTKTQDQKDTDPMSFIENKKKVIRAMLPILHLITDSTRLDHYAQRLALAVNVKTDSIYESLARIGKPTVSSELPVVPSASLTNEEQFLTLAIARPYLMVKHLQQFNNIVWQSVAAITIAEILRNLYNNPTLIKTPTQFLSKVKNNLSPDLEGKIDAWQFWLSGAWPKLNDSTVEQLIDEKLGRLATKQYEQRKESLARDIKRAQEAGKINEVKKLMEKLSGLTKEGK